MASTYSPSLRLELMATGDQSGTWGDTTNTNLGTLLEQSITGYLAKAMADANQTLTSLNGASDEARNMVLETTGALTAARNVIVPTAEKIYLVKNSTTGGFAVTVKTVAGTGVAVPMSGSRWVYCDGTNVVDGLPETHGNIFKRTVIAASGTHTYDSATRFAFVEVQGAGSGSAAVSAGVDEATASPGGSAGGYSSKLITSPPASATIVIGAAGASGVSGGNSQYADGTTTINALGGNCDSAFTGTMLTIPRAPLLGGAASGGDINVTGGVGEPSLSMGATSTGSVNVAGMGGKGADSRFGAGGRSAATFASSSFSQSGQSASGPGAGGGGSFAAQGGTASGAAGGGGLVVITEYR